MNIYLVVSEILYEKIPITDDGDGPLESYCIVELVAAEGRGQARYLAWSADSHFDESDLSSMPNFRTRILRDDFTGYGGLISEYSWAETLWEHPKVLELLNRSEDF